MSKIRQRDIFICRGTGCNSSYAKENFEALKKLIKDNKLSNFVKVKRTGCHGFCQMGPIMVIQPDNVLYVHVQEDDINNIVKEHLIQNLIIERLLYEDPWTGQKIKDMDKVAFYAHQQRFLLEYCGKLDPENINDYIAIAGGYTSLKNVLIENDPSKIIKEVLKSGLRGRGGAGFPTGQKWSFVANIKDEPKYIICNGDEGDPGAFMDRSIFESNPHSVIEGMVIGAFAMGAKEGYIYCRAEYPLAIKRIEIALNQAREKGYLGKNILGSTFSFDIKLKQGAGAFVCGEETALIASIMGKRGIPSQRPPYPAQKGLWGKPTNINNVKTWALIPRIFEKGADWFASIGTEFSKGTIVLALTGKIKNAGLVEIPMGTTIKELIYGIGGGSATGKKVKAIQTGGPSGGCIPQRLFDLTIDYESLKQVGSIMGSGGVIVLDEDTCMVDFARYFTNFLQNESCGKCSSCREGTQRLFEILTNICEGKADIESISLLEELGHVIKDTSLCGLGQTAPNSVLSTIKYFRKEYLEHILEHHCRAGVCTKLLTSPCGNGCPLHLNIPGYLQLLKENRLEEAFELIMLDNPLPATTGRICFAPCNNQCKRMYIDKAINTRGLHRYISDTIYQMKKDDKILERFIGKKLSPTGKKIAIIGAGPSGLTAAYYLVRLGHKIDIYEKHSKPGGNLFYGIPEYRLPKNILIHEINIIKNLGVNLIFNTEVGKDIELTHLIENYDAIYIATGCQKTIPLNVPNNNVPEVLSGIQQLEKINVREFEEDNKKVIIIGGGNTAIDVARSLKRLGKDVIIAYRRTLRDMPANEAEINEALDEKIEFVFMATPNAIISKDDKLQGIELMKTKGGEYETAGRKKPIPTGETLVIPCDEIYTAIGERADYNLIECLRLNYKNNLEINPFTLQSNNPKVFMGGDFIKGPTTVVDAMAEGKKAARNINIYLVGNDNFSELYKNFSFNDEIPLESEISPRINEIEISAVHRVNNFNEITRTLSKEQAVNEASRCIRCDVEIREKNK